jgi:hypothetical protein
MGMTGALLSMNRHLLANGYPNLRARGSPNVKPKGSTERARSVRPLDCER